MDATTTIAEVDRSQSGEIIGGGAPSSRLAIASTIALSLLLSIALARVAVWLQMGGATGFLLMPLFVGSVLGIAISLIPRITQPVSPKVLIAIALCSGLVLSLAEHGFYYSEYCRLFHAKAASNQTDIFASLGAATLSPATFPEFMAAEWPKMAPWWITDAVAMIVISGIAAWWMTNFRSQTMATSESTPT